jgi:hypothetical protein
MLNAPTHGAELGLTCRLAVLVSVAGGTTLAAPSRLAPPRLHVWGEALLLSPYWPVCWASWGTEDWEASVGDSHPGRQVRVWCQVGDGWWVKREMVAASLRAACLICVQLAATVLCFAKHCPTWTMIMWMQPFDDSAMVFRH